MVQVNGYRWEQNKLEFLVLIVDECEIYENHEEYAPAALAFLDFDIDGDDPAENTVIKYINATEKECGAETADKIRESLCSAILALPKKQKAKLVEKYSNLLSLTPQPKVLPPSTQVNTGECHRDHTDPLNAANFEQVVHTSYFRNDGGKLHGLKCHHCKSVITESGALKPTSDKPIYVCKSLMAQTSKSCLCHGAWCYSCYNQHQCNKGGRSRRARNT
jgi:hypothetical protein